MRHYLVVYEDFEDVDSLDVIHDGCPTIEDRMNGFPIFEYDCGVAFEISNNGLTVFFDHISNKSEELGWHEPEYLEPGVYEIEYWSDTWNHGEYGPQYESGLVIVGRMRKDEDGPAN